MDPPKTSILNDTILKSFVPARKIANDFTISCIDYHSSGSHMITASVGALTVYDMSDGERQKRVLSQKYGTDLVKFTHHVDNVLYSGHYSTLRYLSLYDNRHLQYFEGHTEQIVSLDMNPASDQVVTGSFDNTVRFWDLNMPECTAVLTMEAGPKSRPLVAFDPSGKLIAVASVPWVRLYNLAQLERGPFLEFNLEDSLRSVSTHRCQGRLNPTFTSCKFDPTGVHIMLVTNQGLTLIVDSFAGTLETVLGDFEVSTMTATEACFSPDSQYVLRGSLDGTVRCWNRKTAHLVKQWENMHSGAVRCIKFNPVALNFTSTCSHINMWLPKLRSKQQPSEHSSSSNDS